MAHAVWTPLAELEVEEIVFYIRIVDGRPETARRIGQAIRDCADQQAQAPVGQKHPDAPEDWFYVRYTRWLIFYKHHVEGIEVMRVVDAVRDLPSRLRDDEP